MLSQFYRMNIDLDRKQFAKTFGEMVVDPTLLDHLYLCRLCVLAQISLFAMFPNSRNRLKIRDPETRKILPQMMFYVYRKREIIKTLIS